jgi:hypothetical protein
MNENTSGNQPIKEGDRDIPAPETMRRMNDPDGSAYIKGICGDSMEVSHY